MAKSSTTSSKKNTSFKKHPSKHKSKSVRSAFKLGVKTGLNKAKRNN